ncbi:MAG: hypothetical protein HY900_13895 [Deltaproteobacteria bacterium]|nr:hypothetical protein [Deltaproteobacteria bacterium]
MLPEVALGGILGFLAKEAVDLWKMHAKDRIERRRSYHERKLDVTIAATKTLRATAIQLHNCALSLRLLQRQRESGHLEGLESATEIFIEEYREMHRRAKEFPHEVSLFYDLPSFDAVFGEFNQMLADAVSRPTVIVPDGGTETAAELKAILSQAEAGFDNLVGFASKLETKERLMERCIREITARFREAG